MGKFNKQMFLEELKKGDNVYLTNEYLVVQELHLTLEDKQVHMCYLTSYDTYYTLNQARLKVYASLFEKAEDISNGKRIKSMAYRRSYVE